MAALALIFVNNHSISNKKQQHLTVTTFYPSFKDRICLFFQGEVEAVPEQDDDEDYVQTGADDIAWSSEEDDSPPPKRQRTAARASFEDECFARGSSSSKGKHTVKSPTDMKLTTRTPPSGQSKSGSQPTVKESPSMMLLEIERQKLQLMKEQLDIDKKRLNVEEQNGALLREVLHTLKKPSDGTSSTTSEKSTPTVNLSKVRSLFENFKH